MSYRHQDKRRGYSRSRSKSWSKDRARNRDYRDRKDRDDRRRYNETQKSKDERQPHRESRVSIDWRPKKESKHRYESRRQRSRSVSSSSSSSSSYSSSNSRSNSSRHYRRRSSRGRSNERGRDKGHRQDSRSKSQSRRQHYEKKREYRDQRPQTYHRKDHRDYRPYNKSETGRPQIEKTSSRQSMAKPSDNPVPLNQKKSQIESRKQEKGPQIKNEEGQKLREGRANQTGKSGQMIDESKRDVEVETKKDKMSSPQKFSTNQFPKPAGLPQPFKRIQSQTSMPMPERQKVSKVTQLMNEAKRNLWITPLEPNFLMLDSFRTMKKFNAQTLDPTLLSWLQKGLESNLEKEKEKVFGREIKIAEQRQNARITLPSAPSDQELSLRTELESMKVAMINLNHMFRQLRIME